MYEFEPASPTYVISDTIVEHHLRGRDRTRADLPGGYRLTLRTRERHGQLEAALAAPSPTGPARICTARISAHTPTPVTSRILDAVTRFAPALPDARDARPPLAAVARLLTTGAPFQRPDEPGLFVRFGHAEAWLEGRRLGVTLGSPGSGLSLVLGGPWDAPSTARLTAAVLRELTEAAQLAGQVAALLKPGPWQVMSDQWHPDAALVLPATRRPDPEDPLGRRISRALRTVQHDLRAAQPDWDFQELIAAEGSAVALRVTLRERAVPRMVRKVVMLDGFVPDEVGNTRTTFTPADLPAPPDFAPPPPPHEVPSLDLHAAPKNERHSFGVKLELNDWAYALEPRAVFYGPGWYPFHEHVTRREKDPTAPLHDRDVPTGRTVPARVRLSPDVENFSWANEYVQLTPVDHRVQARLHLYVGQERGSTLVRTVMLEIDLRAKRVMLPPQMPTALRHQAEVKGRRILDLLLAARRERRRGVNEPRAVLAPWNRGDPPSADT
ncbi:hypothetical protein [Streptomyces sp. CdTB01]|uniref:hypothetical protein n=1 Tax=Streptomyces sp. CdTB01 TaxID=1725411 RepID=UPI00073ABEF3|nr:hypothetical protein [Streptomyces sp. CdTB01]ALV39153.1 hypothetical protein AS200_44360 [Streptomyces sp. CdTB01]